MTRCALIGVRDTDGDDVFVHMCAVGVMQMLAVEVVGVTVMGDGEMTAARAVLMLMGLGVFVVGATDSDERQRRDEE